MLDLLIDGADGCWQLLEGGKLIREGEKSSALPVRKQQPDAGRQTIMLEGAKAKRLCGDCMKCGNTACVSHQPGKTTTIN